MLPRYPVALRKGFIYVCVFVLVSQSCSTLCRTIDCSPPDSSVHGILQAKILEWVAISFSGNYREFGTKWARQNIISLLINKKQYSSSIKGKF